MSTTCTIMMIPECQEGVNSGFTKYRYIYCHHDGYPEGPHGVGFLLLNFYNSCEKVNELISFGDTSQIKKYVHPDKNKPHSFNNSQRNVCVFYHRDRDDDWDDACYKEDVWKSEDDITGQDWIYLFKQGKWFYKKWDWVKFKRLTPSAVKTKCNLKHDPECVTCKYCKFCET